LQAYLIVFLGAGIGGALRHAVNILAARLLGTGFPYGTLVVNVAGSFAMGLIIAWLAFRGQSAQATRLFLTTGILGGFTTFSTFSLDTMLLVERGETATAILYVALSVAASLAAIWIGYLLLGRPVGS
jgi:CrcB protein